MRRITAPVEDFRRILDLAFSPTVLRDAPDSAQGHSAIAYAAVEVLTGEVRFAARRRARPRASTLGFWAAAGVGKASLLPWSEELRRIGPRRKPYGGPWADGLWGRVPVSQGGGALSHIRAATPKLPFVIFTRTDADSEVYIQTYRLGRGSTMVEHREGAEPTHGHHVAPTTAAAAAIVEAWLGDEPTWREQPWLPGMPDVRALAEQDAALVRARRQARTSSPFA